MSRWDKKCEFSQDKAFFNPITTVSVGATGDIVVAGSLSGQVFVFEKRISSGCWDHVYTWGANSKTIDVKMQKEVNPIVIDTELFPTKRKNPLLLTAGQQDIHIWFISDKYEPLIPDDYIPNGIKFPVSTRRERFINANEVSRLRAGEGNSITSVRACNDGLCFSYTEDKSIKIGRLDNLDRVTTIYSSEQLLTKVDFNPVSSDILIAGDAKGVLNLIDSRTEPKLSQPTMKAVAASSLPGRYSIISECKFSPSGEMIFTRHPGDILFWDPRNLSRPVSSVRVIEKDDYECLDGNEQFRCSWFDNQIVCAGSVGGEMKLVNSSGVIDCTQTSKKHGLFFFKDVKKWKKTHSVFAIESSNGNVAAVSNGSKLFIYDCKP